MLYRPLVLFVLVSLSAASQGLGQDYAVIDLGAQTTGWAINQLGWVTGARGESAYLWRNGTFETRPRAGGGCCSFGFSINNLGEIAGRQGQLFNESAALWLADGTLVDLGRLGTPKAEAKGINDQRVIVGWSHIEPEGIRGWVWENDEFTIIDPLVPDGTGSTAESINESGQATGAASYDNQTHDEPFLWENGEMVGLGVLEEGRQAWGQDINNNTQVVGYANVRTKYHAFLWENGEMTDIHQDEAPAWDSYALGINDDGLIVGQLDRYGTNDFVRACIWIDGELRELDEFLPRNSEWTLVEARDINNFGQIVGNGKYRQQNTHAFMLSPVTPTLALAAPSPGRAGAVNTLTITGCDPGTRLHFLYARHGGGTIIPGCDLQLNALQLDQPILIGSAIADANGQATLTRFVPNSARNLGDILIQAVQLDGCKISQLVVHQFD